MPNTKSALKEMRKNERRRIRNRIALGIMKSAIKKIKSCKTFEEANKLLPEVIKKIDQTARKGVIHKNKANRLKSRIMRFVNIMQQSKNPT
jgi:small subunit ribosomal protein S20